MAETHTPFTHTNRLVHETSPYLLQHAHNPVDWYPWGEEALTRAKNEDKPILLSIGYSACHWCHVMAHESFEDEKIAELINAHFIAIKVDREERPDVDAIYMQAVQAMTQQGGWPMTMFLTPDGKPFYGGTYFPPRDRRYGTQVMPGFPRILLNVSQVFAERRQEVEEQANQLAMYLHQQSSAPLYIKQGQQQAADEQPLRMLSDASRKLAADFDATYGGFGGAPKFPNAMTLEFLLRVHLHRQHGELPLEEADELTMIETTLQQMAQGGIYDQLGGGFHRYSVDERWLVPHFEKMLYDNALLSHLYLLAYLVTGRSLYRRIVEETLDYVVREMTSPEGGFYSTQDADSEGEEGKFFLWTPQEIVAVLPPQDAELFARYYDVTEQGNFEGKNILHIQEDIERFAVTVGQSVAVVQASLEQSRKVLFQLREQRVKPGRDEKILTAWNGLMLRSFAEAARYLGRADYLQVAEKNADFLLQQMRQDGRLLRTYKDGRAHLNGYLEDHSFLADGLLALYEASFTPRWFTEAQALMEQAIAQFADQQNGGFFDTSHDHETLISRPKDLMDNATPAGNNVAIAVLARLAAFNDNADYQQQVEVYLQSLAELFVQHPQAFGQALCALDFVLSARKEIAIIGEKQRADTRALLSVVNQRYLPNSVVACADPADHDAISAIALLAGRPAQGGKATAYVCQNFVCRAPVTGQAELAAQL
ncbi:MAG TPA: thioredoxin domain-containing protein [Dictyobacter sp.]|jgi:uncharacterized protein YyaL (SSP411 family)|nr:thioredoxin domain-containing protein [Dictyobacter sp.]